ncbi:hypothetical protein [Psychromicrobium lacuslunae]|uniref:Uncharacterized protein n=1 Tax=Psychromicrobium lacuslunae TaxID=1618207 RepID=A0A0D4C098_9MICC|nr:hypothetical protein [Psychromicrobium lacuslunae]AJT41840.1 hypothetical protein UM93_10515 [Psychromicrobium lacuslunae]
MAGYAWLGTHSGAAKRVEMGEAMRALRQGFLLIGLTMLTGSSLLGLSPLVANAAPSVTTRVAAFSAAPAKVYAGNSITLQAQVQRLAGKSWVKTGALNIGIWFDPDGAKPNALVRTVKTNASGYLKASQLPAVSGRWSLRLPATSSYKASISSQLYVQVLAAVAKPISKNSCPSWAPIKGNKQSHIYHLPGQRFYKATNPELCFATEAAAVKAGYRKAKV